MHSAEDFGPKADGVKVWRSSGMTAVLHISAPTVEYIVDLVEELRAQDKAHTLVAVNCAWTSGGDVGQLWQRCVATACAMLPTFWPLQCNLRNVLRLEGTQ